MSDMLGDRKHVAVGILEPRDLVAAGGCPDAEFLILHERVFLAGHAAAFEPSDDCRNILHFPAEDGERQGSEILRSLRDADLGVASADHQGEGILTDKLKTKLVFVEFPRSLGI